MKKIASIAFVLMCLLMVVTTGCSTTNKSISNGDMAPIYKSMRLTNARVVGGPFSTGDVVIVAYKLKNVSKDNLHIPVDASFSRPFNLIGTLQHWIERQGNEDRIAGIAPQIAREGSRYAAGGSIVPTKSTITAGESLPFEQRISTTGYPVGKYTYYIEYKKVQGDEIQTAKVEFELIE